MFGFLRSRPGVLSKNDWTALNLLQCGLCHVFRQGYGTWASLLANWEGRFLALLTYSQYAQETELTTTRCPASLWVHQCPAIESNTALQYAAAIVMRLVQEKMADDIRDEKSPHTKWINRLLRPHFGKAKSTLQSLDFPSDSFDSLLKRQFAIESCEQIHDLDDATAPFADAMGLLTAHTCRIGGVSENYDILNQIGRLIGRVITIIDASHDFDRDFKNNQYNVIRETTPYRTPDTGLTSLQIEAIENYLLLNLNAICRNTLKLTFFRNAGAVQNILLLGLYDASMHAIQKISKNTDHLATKPFNTPACTSCGELMSSRFCPHCGEIAGSVYESASRVL